MSSTPTSGTEFGPDGGSSDPNADRNPEETGELGIPGTSEAAELAPAEGGDSSDEAGADSATADDNRGEGGSAEGEGDSRQTIPAVPAASGKQKRINDRDVDLALKAAEGNMRLAARALGVDHATIVRRVKRTPHLFALYGAQAEGSTVPVETEVSTMIRTKDDIPPLVEVGERAEAIMAQDREILRDGLRAAGIEPKTIERIRALDGLARNAGALLSASLDYTHRLHIYSTAALFEEMIYIRDTYLRPAEEGKPKIDPMVQVFWMRAFNEIADLLGKSNDRTMASTQAMVAMMKAQNGGKGSASASPKAKPGW